MMQRTSRNQDLICGARLYVLPLLYASGLRVPVFDALCLMPLRAPRSLLQKGVLVDKYHVSQPVYPATMIFGSGFRLCAELAACA